MKTVYSPKMCTSDIIKVRDILDIGEEWQVLAELKPPRREHGTYMFSISMTWEYDRTTSSAEFSFSSDGGKTWNNFSQEPKDITDFSPFSYQYPFDLTESYPHFIFRGRKEALQGEMNVLFLDLWMQRIG